MFKTLKSPPKPDAGLIKKQQKRMKILRAAEQLFSQQGDTLPTVSAIGKAAGIGKGTTYLYFESKEEIFLNILSQYHIQWLQHLATATHDLDGNVDVIITEHNQHFVNYPNHLLLASGYELWFRTNVSEAVRTHQENLVKREMTLSIKALNQVFSNNDAQITHTLIEQLYAVAIGQWQLQKTPQQKLQHIYEHQKLVWQHYKAQLTSTHKKGWKSLFN